MAIRDQRHANVSKQTPLLAGDDVALSIGAAYITWPVNVLDQELKSIENDTLF